MIVSVIFLALTLGSYHRIVALTLSLTDCVPYETVNDSPNVPTRTFCEPKTSVVLGADAFSNLVKARHSAPVPPLSSPTRLYQTFQRCYEIWRSFWRACSQAAAARAGLVARWRYKEVSWSSDSLLAGVAHCSKRLSRLPLYLRGVLTRIIPNPTSLSSQGQQCGCYTEATTFFPSNSWSGWHCSTDLLHGPPDYIGSPLLSTFTSCILRCSTASLVDLHSSPFLGSFCFHLWRGEVVYACSVTQPEWRIRIRQLFFSMAETPVL